MAFVLPVYLADCFIPHYIDYPPSQPTSAFCSPSPSTPNHSTLVNLPHLIVSQQKADSFVLVPLLAHAKSTGVSAKQLAGVFKDACSHIWEVELVCAEFGDGVGGSGTNQLGEGLT